MVGLNMLKKGDKVKMTEKFKKLLLENSEDLYHIEEFGNCIGTVEGLVNWNKNDENKPDKFGPEVSVRWQPLNLNYAYYPSDLEKVDIVNSVIFLDIDGVVTSAKTGWLNFDIYVVNFLIWLCKEAGMKIVISSTWRHNHNKNFWDKIFPNCIHESYKTPDIGDDIRGKEIAEWLRYHPEVTEYIIIDDDDDMLPEQMTNFIKTDSFNGMSFENMNQILTELHIKSHPFDYFIKELYIHEEMFGTKKPKLMNDE